MSNKKIVLYFSITIWLLLAIPYFVLLPSNSLAGEEPPALREEQAKIELKRLQSGSVAEKVEALERLGHPRTAQLAESYRLELIQFAKTTAVTEELELQRQMCQTLGRISPPDSEVESIVIVGFSHQKPAVRRACVLALGNILAGSKKSIPQLKALLDDPDPQVKYRAVETLAKIGSKEQQAQAVRYMVRMLDIKVDLEPEEQNLLPQSYRAAQEMMGRVTDQEQVFIEEVTADPDLDGAIAQILQSLKHHNAFVRQTSAKILGVIKSKSTSSNSQILASLGQEQDPKVAIELLQSIQNIAPPPSTDLIAVVSKQITSPNPKVRTATLQTVGQLKLTDLTLLPLLNTALSDNYEPASVYAAWSLTAYGPAAKDSVPILIQQLQRKNAEQQHTAFILQALHAIGNKEAIAAIEKFKAEYQSKEKERASIPQ